MTHHKALMAQVAGVSTMSYEMGLLLGPERFGYDSGLRLMRT
jgi:hypothetical protein